MAEILICPHPLTPDQLQNQYGLDASCLQGSCDASHTQVLSKPYSPYLIENTLTEIDRGIYNQLAGMSPAQAKTLTQIAQTVGEEQTVAIAEVTAKLHDFNLGMMGATTGVYGNGWKALPVRHKTTRNACWHIAQQEKSVRRIFI